MGSPDLRFPHGRFPLLGQIQRWCVFWVDTHRVHVDQGSFPGRLDKRCSHKWSGVPLKDPSDFFTSLYVSFHPCSETDRTATTVLVSLHGFTFRGVRHRGVCHLPPPEGLPNLTRSSSRARFETLVRTSVSWVASQEPLGNDPFTPSPGRIYLYPEVLHTTEVFVCE